MRPWTPENTPPPKYRVKHAQGVLGGSRSCFWRYQLLVFCKHPHLWFYLIFHHKTFLGLTPLIGLTPPPFYFQGFTVAILNIETRSENKKFSICPKLTFLFLDHVSIFNIATKNPPPKYRANHAQSVLGGSRSYFWRYQNRVFCNHPHFCLTNFYVIWPFWLWSPLRGAKMKKLV